MMDTAESFGWAVVAAALASGCGNDIAGVATLSGGDSDSGDTGTEPTTATSTGSGSSGSNGDEPGGPADTGSSEGDDGGVIFDLGVPDMGNALPQCTVGDDISGIGPCDLAPLAESFDAQVQWSWGPGSAGSLVTPLVANLTDDNGDGSIDLCDTPDVVVLTTAGGKKKPGTEWAGGLVALDGDSEVDGSVHWVSEAEFDISAGPALGDIDGDGLVEIVAVTRAYAPPHERRLVAISNEGEQEWISQPLWYDNSVGDNVALADMDADGDVEILISGGIYDHLGNLVAPVNTGPLGGFAVDLDDDGDLEYVHAWGAHHHDGSLYFDRESGASRSFPHVADLDGDGDPELVYSQPQVKLDESAQIVVYDHLGAQIEASMAPLGAGLPGAMHDMDGDGTVDFGVGRQSNGDWSTFSVFEFAGTTPTPIWTAPTDGGCCSGGTAFDFLGDGTAEAVFADDHQLRVFDSVGNALATWPRPSPTLHDYPIVADVDNDGAAEIVVAAAMVGSPAVIVLHDINEGWVPARRIWNQHTYHVTNIREDGTIPAQQPKNWQSLNTFRTQAQISAGTVCVPPAG